MPQSRQIKQDLTIPKNQAYRKSLQRLRWFRSTFKEQTEAIEAGTDIQFNINSEILAECFVEWIRTFKDMKPTQSNQRLAYVGFAAGQMLKQLIVKKPLCVVSMPDTADASLPEYFWPEGFVYVAYCLNVRQAVLCHDFGVHIHESPSLDKLGTWWSFKENVHENANYAISFLDLFAGEQPNWIAPGLFNGTQRARQLEQLIKGQIPLD